MGVGVETRMREHGRRRPRSGGSGERRWPSPRLSAISTGPGSHLSLYPPYPHRLRGAV